MPKETRCDSIGNSIPSSSDSAAEKSKSPVVEDSNDNSNWLPLDSSCDNNDRSMNHFDLTSTRLRSSSYSLSENNALVEDSSSSKLPDSDVESKPLRSKPDEPVWSRTLWTFLLVGTLVFLLPDLLTDSPFKSLETGHKSVYVSGGGFSGFWFTLGRLNSVQDLMDRDYYCVSAGCLAVVAVFQNYTVHEMIDKAEDARSGWMNGKLNRYEVVPRFLDNMLNASASPSNNHRIWKNDQVLSKINIITTVPHSQWPWGGQVATRNPTSMEDLRTMLLQTTWIPFAVGQSWWHLGHMDGAFSLFYHPRCASTVRLPINLDLISNALNIGLDREKATEYWELGLQYGV